MEVSLLVESEIRKTGALAITRSHDSHQQNDWGSGNTGVWGTGNLNGGAAACWTQLRAPAPVVRLSLEGRGVASRGSWPSSCGTVYILVPKPSLPKHDECSRRSYLVVSPSDECVTVLRVAGAR